MFKFKIPTNHALVAIALLLMPMALTWSADKVVTWTADDPALQWGACPDFLPEGCALAVLQGDPTKLNADVFFRLPGNSTVAHHWHTSAERMVLVQGEFHVFYDDHDPVVMRAGTYAYGPARLPHSAECRSSEPCVLFIAFEEPVDAIPTGHEH
ncbi:MAG: cupin domain-containing protein [Gammaproteobacteria bacterium]|nr:cupin domain-containing protein [Gammaproteobacteria bacterium]